MTVWVKQPCEEARPGQALSLPQPSHPTGAPGNPGTGKGRRHLENGGGAGWSPLEAQHWQSGGPWGAVTSGAEGLRQKQTVAHGTAHPACEDLQPSAGWVRARLRWEGSLHSHQEGHQRQQ